MFRFIGRLVRKAFELATRRILREALASAIVTIVVTAAFTGFAAHTEPPVPPALVTSRPVAEVPAEPSAMATAPAPGPATVDYAKVWFDPNAVSPNPTGFRRTASIAPAAATAHAPHRRSPVARQPQTPNRPIVQAAVRTDDKTLGRGRAPDALAKPAPVPEKSGFRVWGVAPADLIPSMPSASSLMKGVKSVGTSVAGLIPSL